MGLLNACMENRACTASILRKKTVRDLMSSPARTIDENATLAETSARFAGHKINRLPVVDGENKLVGIVTRADVVGYLPVCLRPCIITE